MIIWELAWEDDSEFSDTDQYLCYMIRVYFTGQDKSGFVSLRDVLRRRCSQNISKYLKKYFLKSLFLSKVTGFIPATLLKMTSFK